MSDLMKSDDIVVEESYLEHYGTPRHSGRYPWGSGKNPQRSRTWLSNYNDLKKKGLSDSEIAKALGFDKKGGVSEMRSKRAAVMEMENESRYNYINKLKEKGMSTSAIARRLGTNESTVRGIINRGLDTKRGSIRNVAGVLKEQIKKKDAPIDIGENTNLFLNVTENRLKDAVAYLKESEGYYTIYPRVRQLTTGFETQMKFLVPPSIDKKSAYQMIKDGNGATVEGVYFEGGNTGKKVTMERPKSVDRNRIMVRYGDEGGADKDGTIELRRGVADLNLGDSKYGQVRVLVGKDKYMKGMAFYSDDMPKGVDIIYNSNKPSGSPDDKVFKTIKPVGKDENDPSQFFGAAIMRQNKYTDADGKEHVGALNIVNEEGTWNTWSKTLASQMLSKQPLVMAKKQLKIDATIREDQFNDINNLTNGTLKSYLMKEFADECDSAAVHLKAAALPRQSTKVILPVTSLKDNEVYAPTYKNGEEVALIRYPHGGTFEIPVLKVNNNNKEGIALVGKKPLDAIGINPNVAKRLSGADFDGDSVVIFPTKGQHLKVSKPLKELENFDPGESYPPISDKPAWPKGSQREQTEMGKISNLITDMTLMGAPDEDLAKAVRHSMVVIDVGKHAYDYKRSYEENGIADLKRRYQPKDNGKSGGSATLISKAKSEEHVPLRSPNAPYKIDPNTGEKIFTVRPDRERFYSEYKKDPITGEKYPTGKIKERTTTSTKMYEAKDARSLSSGLPMEEVYAEYANHMKALGDRARKASIDAKPIEYSPAANTAYRGEVESLYAKLQEDKKRRPRERIAQMKANASFRLKQESNPDLTNSEKKKLKDSLLRQARESFGIEKKPFIITPKEWEAIQSGAVRPTTLKAIFQAADDEQLKKLATPSYKTGMSPSKIAAAKAMLKNNNYTLNDVAEALGVSVSTLEKNVDIKANTT